MGAPEHAISLAEENPDWAKGSSKKTRVTCQGCGWKGKMYQLLCIDEETTLWCPQCGTAAWIFD